MSGPGTAGSAAGTTRRAGSSGALENLARVGLIAYGVVHLLIAWLALQLAWGGNTGAPADQSGAMATLAEQPVGKPLLWVIAVGMIALAAWQLTEALLWRRGLSLGGEARTRALKKIGKSVAKTAVYLALAVLAIRFATGGGQSSSGQQQQETSGVFSWPGGRWLVGIAGLVVIGVGVYLVYKGLSKRFLKEIDLAQAPPKATALVEKLGMAGYPAKGVALGLVGGLLVYAAVTFDPAKATGLDGALRTVLAAPFGQLLLTLIAVGIAAFGAFCFIRARYPERT
ncbi:DUF1206 domain-containing protein [Geodermatophilus ruber]|uniref:DUF1206 domain-containing protein n=1 Tax=Geodermatophilus ruber TaxID=504800 RepID=A0A1I4GWH0_9ACTN|nr:DUF1206 domain-containing protein [Geodermatophilus ruber]SFL34299.1 protein of unknown function [Geodermatophilus ruber]